MKAFAQRHHTTPFMLVLAAYALMLARACRQEEVVVASTFANRSLESAELVGYLTNVLPLRLPVAACDCLTDLVSSCQVGVYTVFQA